ncbi:hypothetical protein [Saccharopolyspora sp. NPDC002376]
MDSIRSWIRYTGSRETRPTSPCRDTAARARSRELAGSSGTATSRRPRPASTTRTSSNPIRTDTAPASRLIVTCAASGTSTDRAISTVVTVLVFSAHTVMPMTASSEKPTGHGRSRRSATTPSSPTPTDPDSTTSATSTAFTGAPPGTRSTAP